jgi:general stress protein 26
LTGNIEIVTDKTLKNSLWMDMLTKHFPNGGKDDPEYCVLKFTTTEATIYINEHFGTVKI